MRPFLVPRRAAAIAACFAFVAVLGAGAPLALAGESVSPVGAAGDIAWKRVEDDHPWLRWGGKWTFLSYPEYSRGSSHASGTNKAWGSITFKGTAVSLVARTGPDRGQARVYVDGKAIATVSQYAESVTFGTIVWKKTGLSSGKHTVKVVALGTKESASTGTRVDVDAFEIAGTLVSPGAYPGKRVQNGDQRLYQKGSWKKIKRKAAFGDSVVRTSKKKASVKLTFTGTGVIWYGRKSTSGGKAEVWLDGKKVAVVSQYATKTAEPRVVWAASGLKKGTHKLTVVCAGAKAADGGGTQTEVDAFQVQGSAKFTPRPTPFKYHWKTYIVIDKSSFKLYWVKNGTLRNVYPIAHGRKSMPTPSRVWRIGKKYRTSPGSVYGPRKMRLYKRVKTSHGYRYAFTNYAIHGTNQEWVIGTRASHGCIRMYNKDVRELYPQVPIGTMVVTRN